MLSGPVDADEVILTSVYIRRTGARAGVPPERYETAEALESAVRGT